MKTYLKEVSEVETNASIFGVELGETLKFTTVNQLEGKALSILDVEFGECGMERKSDWMRFGNKLNDYDTTPIKRMLLGNKKQLDYGDYIMSIADIDYSEDGITITFKTPQPIVLEKVGTKYLIAEVTEIRGKFTWEWYYRKSHKEVLGNYAGICEVYLHEIEIIK